MILSQERQWQEEADILALDQEGTLYIFEIKRTQSDQSNLLQVIRYGQIFGQSSYEYLEYLFRKYRRDHAGSLAAAHRDYFELHDELPQSAFNRRQRFIVVTAGVDRKTLDAIEYWRKNGLPIEPITYHVYQQGQEYLLDFTAYAPTPEDYLGLISHEWIVNTNVTYDPAAYQEMLNGSKAAAYYYRKAAVDEIQPGDRVFLYHTKVGIIAAGKATESIRRADRDGNQGEEHYIPLRFELKADPLQDPQQCLPAWEINRALGTTYTFRQTAFRISKGMADTITTLLRQKQQATTTS